MDKSILYNALRFPKLGYKIFPLGIQSKIPATKHGYKNATKDENKIRKMWNGTQYNIGLPCKDNNILVLDVDPRNGGDESLKEIIKKHGDLPKTISAKTGGGGYHYFFNHPNCKIKTKLEGYPGIDIKSNGYIVVAPSIHPSGGIYEWTHDPENVNLADIPEWLLNLIEKKSKRCVNIKKSKNKTTKYGQTVLSNSFFYLLNANKGNRNNTLSKCALNIFCFVLGGEIDENEARDKLYKVAFGIGLTHSEIIHTINSAYKKAKESPKSVSNKNWMENLLYNKNSIIVKNSANVSIIFENDEEWKDSTKYNEFTNTVIWIKSPLKKISGEICNKHLTCIQKLLQKKIW